MRIFLTCQVEKMWRGREHFCQIIWFHFELNENASTLFIVPFRMSQKCDMHNSFSHFSAQCKIYDDEKNCLLSRFYVCIIKFLQFTEYVKQLKCVMLHSQHSLCNPLTIIALEIRKLSYNFFFELSEEKYFNCLGK